MSRNPLAAASAVEALDQVEQLDQVEKKLSATSTAARSVLGYRTAPRNIRGVSSWMPKAPWTLRYEVDELAQKWNTLCSQVTGRAIGGRKDIPRKLQALCIARRRDYRLWVQRIMSKPLVEAFGSYEDDFNAYNAVYEQVRGLVAKALPEGENVAAGPATDRPFNWEWIIYPMLAIGGITAAANLITALKRNGRA